ncbi:hypothetical protein DFJ73DRAFT_842821, partial [Zopfochytrium polystomum]
HRGGSDRGRGGRFGGAPSDRGGSRAGTNRVGSGTSEASRGGDSGGGGGGVAGGFAAAFANTRPIPESQQPLWPPGGGGATTPDPSLQDSAWVSYHHGASTAVEHGTGSSPHDPGATKLGPRYHDGYAGSYHHGAAAVDPSGYDGSTYGGSAFAPPQPQPQQAPPMTETEPGSVLWVSPIAASAQSATGGRPARTDSKWKKPAGVARNTVQQPAGELFPPSYSESI